MSTDRRLQDIAADTYLVTAMEIAKEWQDKTKAKGVENKTLDALVDAILNTNMYVMSLRMERLGYDHAIDGANNFAKRFEQVADEQQLEIEKLREKLKLYEL